MVIGVSSLTKRLLQVMLSAHDIVSLDKALHLDCLSSPSCNWCLFTLDGGGVGWGGGLLICDRLVSHLGGVSDFYPLIIKDMAD